MNLKSELPVLSFSFQMANSLQCVCVPACLAQQLHQGGPATLRSLNHVPDHGEEVVEETKAQLHAEGKTISVSHRVPRQSRWS